MNFLSLGDFTLVDSLKYKENKTELYSELPEDFTESKEKESPEYFPNREYHLVFEKDKTNIKPPYKIIMVEEWGIFFKKKDDLSIEIVKQKSLKNHLTVIMGTAREFFKENEFSLEYFLEPDDTNPVGALIIIIHTKTYDPTLKQAKLEFHNWLYDYTYKERIDTDIVFSLE